MTSDAESVFGRTGVRYDRIHHPRTTSAVAEAAAVGWPPTHVGKTVIVRTEDGYVRCVVRAVDKVDLHKLRVRLGDRTARLATETEIAAAYPSFELGATPPWGGPACDRVLIDERVAAHPSVVLEAGTHDESVRVGVADLRVLTAAQIVDLAA
ncbi:MAG TPA: YbaK/EbsC family protein [Gaiellaceae bacterium]|nr:YbaK/EbsC family protein [Gaiellaceae bacterium]